MKIKIFENETVKECLLQCITEGYFPATIKETYDLIKKGKIEDRWYTTSTYYYKGNMKNITLKQIKNIKELYNKGLRLLFFNDTNYGLSGNNYLNYNGRFVGVKK